MKQLAVFVFASVLAATACSSGKQEVKQASASSGATASPSATAHASPSHGRTRAPASASSPAAAAAGGLTSPAPASGRISSTGSPPKTGTYTYTVTMNGDRSTRRTTVASEGGSSSETKQVEKASSGKATSAQHVIWRRDGKYLADIVSNQGDNRFECDWKPDLIEYRFPMKTAARWSQTTSCTTTIGTAKITSTVHTDSVVRGTGRVTIGGKSVNVWIIDTKLSSTSSYSGRSTSGRVDRTTDFAPDVGVAVRYEETSHSSSGTTTSTFELQNVNPS